MRRRLAEGVLIEGREDWRRRVRWVGVECGLRESSPTLFRIYTDNQRRASGKADGVSDESAGEKGQPLPER